eukprot:TRINITY_DN1809_c0_g1_i1.p1 TRINITY_DN1809_c0_g1~~TRINITY_DN1809_c0_g1_i1.p1  ORF type:complete len:503 (+),score=85.13 TRINITY_DN1809_c0_g1_i1:121-1629(+)
MESFLSNILGLGDDKSTSSTPTDVPAADPPTILTDELVNRYFKDYAQVNSHDRDDLCHAYIFDKTGKDKEDYEEMVAILREVLHPQITDHKVFFEKGTKEVLAGLFRDVTCDKAMGSFMGMLLGDTLGAPFEFSSYRTGVEEMKDGFSEVAIWQKHGYNRFQLKPGQWTDDASMGLCLADSLISCNSFDGVDLRFRFHRWWTNGYCNAFGWDAQRRKSYHGTHSVGLGGNISLSMYEFTHYKGDPSPVTKKGDRNTSGNGSVMRNAAVPLFYYKDITKALQYADEQSKSTHQGDEAGECCQLMTYLIVSAMQDPQLTKDQLLLKLQNFQVVKSEDGKLVKGAPLKTVVQLCNSEGEWNWRSPDFRYEQKRAESQPGYIGSYAMDAVAMSLHCLHTTSSFTDCLLKCANMRGDSDSVCSVAGQIAGAVYGFGAIPKNWIYTIFQWDRDMFTLLRAYKLFKHAPSFPVTPAQEPKTDDPPAAAEEAQNAQSAAAEDSKKDDAME